MSEQSCYYLITYRRQIVGPKAPIVHFVNAVIDQDPAEWLHLMLIRHDSETIVLLYAHRLTAQQYERMSQRVNTKNRTRSLPRPKPKGEAEKPPLKPDPSEP
tara:strand:- start:222 stop:527 length:306 start_codon:yes stop_codon:yes gene_type:complete